MKRTVLVILVIVFVAAAAGFYWYQKPRTSLAKVEADHVVTAKDLYNAFATDEQKANQQFVEKVLLVKGTIANVEATDSTINLVLSSENDMGGINCSLAKSSDTKAELIKAGSVVQVKGRCVGFLMDVNLVDAIIAP